MVFVALTTFLTVAILVWALFGAKGEPVPADGPALRHIQRSDHGLDLALERLAIPYRARDALLTVIATGIGAGALVGMVSGDVSAALATAGAIPLLAAVELRRRLAASDARLMDQLPDALLMMANALKAGHTLSLSFKNLGDELPAPLGPEFARVVRALQMGASPESALDDLRRRLRNTEVDMMVQAILIQRETGGNLAEILTNIAGSLRERIKLKGKVRALTAQGKLSGLVIGALPFALFAFLWFSSREYLQAFLREPVGQQAMAVALLGQLVGYMAIQRIVNFKI